MLGVVGCTPHSGGATPATPAKQASAAPSDGPPSAPTPNRQLANQTTAALLRGDYKEAAAIVDRARQLSPAVRPSALQIAYFEATVQSYRGDYRRAVKVMYDHIAAAGATSKDAFIFHDAMIALRAADGDLLGALVECEEMTKAGTLGTWTPSDGDRMTWVRLKEYWHRAYLLRMLAQTLADDERTAFIAYAESARQEYVALAAPLRTMGDSIAVLNAYFAFCDGAPARMREAATQVNVAEDDDVEDLYLVQLALDGSGAAAAAAAVRDRISTTKAVTVLTPVFLAWMQSDAVAAAGRPPRFSPKHPTGARPPR